MAHPPRRRLKLAELHQAVNAAGLPPVHAAVMHQIVGYCDGIGGCYPSQGTLASRAGISRRQLQRVFTELRDAELFTTGPLAGSYLAHRVRKGTRTQGRLLIRLTPAGPKGVFWRESWKRYWTNKRVSATLLEPAEQDP